MRRNDPVRSIQTGYRRIYLVFYAGIFLVAAATTVTAVGYALPVAHVATQDVLVNAAPEAVFARISDPARYREWRPDLDSVELLGSEPLRWREHSGGDAITYEEVERSAASRFVTRIADKDLPFGGTWTWELQPEGTGTRVTITERGEVYNPVFRFMSRFVFSRTATMERVLRQLQNAAPLVLSSRATSDNRTRTNQSTMMANPVWTNPPSSATSAKGFWSALSKGRHLY
jgi:uncharacterized protein YndB with AHSA1/START domain